MNQLKEVEVEVEKDHNELIDQNENEVKVNLVPLIETIPENFITIINDFTKDLLITFPECESTISLWWSEETNKIEMVFKHCLKFYPERFFDILNKNEDIFKTDSTVSTEFLPYIIFKHLWKCEITENTKNSIWKYLQLILFSIINSVKDFSSFGDTANLFNSIDESDFKNKLQDALTSVQNDSNKSHASTSSPSPLPSADDIHSHMNGMLNGKLGDLAKEIAEETAESLDIDFENMTGIQDVFQSLFKNPAKLMNIVKNVGDKLDSRIKSGDIDQSELMSEATEMMSKMKNMPGLENIQEMMSKMGLGAGGLGDLAGLAATMGNKQKQPNVKPNKDKVNVQTTAQATAQAMQTKLKQEDTRNRLKKKLDLKQLQETQQKLTQQHEEDLRLNNILNDTQLIEMFNKVEKPKKKKDKKE